MEFKSSDKSYCATWKKLIQTVLDFTLGPYMVEKFEKDLAKYMWGQNIVISTNNGTDALILSLKSLGVKKG